MRSARCGVALACLLLTASGLSAQGPELPAGIHLIPLAQLKLPQPATSEVMGYPAVSSDRLVVSAMLREGRFDELDRYLTGLQGAVRGRIQLEYDLLEATRAFADPDTAVGTALMRWMTAVPGSARARSALATWHLAKAWAARGDGSGSSVSPSAAAEMENWLRQALDDAREAIRLDSANYNAYGELLDGLTLTGDQGQARTVYDASRRAYPGSHYLAHLFIKRLEPRWGGSYEAMNAFAAEIAADSLINPRLRTFLGAAENDIADMAIGRDSIMMALRHANASLRYGPELYYLVDRGHANAHFGDYARAITDLNAVLAQWPHFVPALENHAEAISYSAFYVRGGERSIVLKELISQYQLILSLEPANTWARNGLKDALYELATCPEFAPECGNSQAGVVSVVQSVWRDIRWLLGYLGVAGFISWRAYLRWAKSGFYLPRYVHLIALLALLTIGYIQRLWVLTGAPMTLRRWVVTATLPLLVYILFIGLGGARHAQQARAPAPSAPRKP